MNWKRFFGTSVILILTFSSVTFSVRAQEKTFTAAELEQYDGRDGHAAYFAYKGKVYDVSTSSLWKLGEHFGVHAGYDLTGKMEGAPHGDEVLSGFPVVGLFQAIVSTQAPAPTPVEAVGQAAARQWYDAPLRISGFSILGITGLLLGIVFVLNFVTCFALPWSKLPVPWRGSRIGPDGLDQAPVRKNLASIHKYFAWATVVIGLIHGLLGFLQMFFKIYL